MESYTLHRKLQRSEQVNAVAPLSIAIWHRHVDFLRRTAKRASCRPPGAACAVRNPGQIHTEEACKNAGGLWIPVVFGWMTHVYPNATGRDEMWGGADMRMDANTDSDEIKQ